MTTDPQTNPNVRELLIEHIDGRPVLLSRHSPSPATTFGDRIAWTARSRMVRSLLDQKLLQSRVCADGVGMETVITEKGRAALAKALADWADAICRAHTRSDGKLEVPLWADPPLPRWASPK